MGMQIEKSFVVNAPRVSLRPTATQTPSPP